MKDENPKLIHKKRRLIMKPAAACCCRGSNCSWLFLGYIFVFWSERLRRGFKKRHLRPCVDVEVLRVDGFVLCYRQF